MNKTASPQFKVWAFLRRNTALLDHDEYRAAHVGFHCSHTRRLRNIRGYTVNIHDDDDELGRRLVASGVVTLRSEPSAFLDLWDGFPAVLFDDREAWLAAGTQEATRAGPKGLMIDPDWTLSDGPYLFDRVNESLNQFRSYHTRMEEYIVEPVVRHERRPCKLVQFFRTSSQVSDPAFEQAFFTEYLEYYRETAGLHGLVANFRDEDIDAAARDYYPEDHWSFSLEGRDFRMQFYRLWDGALELYFDDLDAFLLGRQSHPRITRLLELEDKLFDALWYVNVDENMIVMPDRGTPPTFYHR